MTTGTPRENTREAMKRSPAPIRSRAESANRIASTSSNDASTVRCMCSVRASRGRWNPGRSTSTSWWSSPFAIPKIRRRVVCGLSETIATLPPASAFTSVDLPTLGRPATATNPLLTRARRRARDPHPHPYLGGARPSSLAVDDTAEMRSRGRRKRVGPRPNCNDCSRGQIPRLREQFTRRERDYFSLRIRERHALDPKLVQPLSAAAAGRGRDRDLGEVAGTAPVDDGAGDRGPLGADSKRIRGVLDVDALVDAPVLRANGGADQIVRIRRVGTRGRGPCSLEKLVAHEKSWKIASVTSAPSRPP